MTEDGPALCGAKAKSTGEPCKLRRVPGRTRCRLHGGASPRGRASPQWKHGRRQRPHNRIGAVLSDARREAFEHYRDEKDQLLNALALCGVRAEELVTSLESGETAQWRDVSRLLRRLRDAMAAGDASRTQMSLSQLQHVASIGAGTEHTWHELLRVFRESGKLARTQAQIERDRMEVVHRDRLLDLMEQIADLFSRVLSAHIADEKTRRDALGDVHNGLKLLVSGE